MGQELLFRKEYTEYTRDFDYLKLWAEQCTTYAKIQNPQLNEDQYKQYLYRNAAKDGKFPMFNPRIKVIKKDENNDRQRAHSTLQDYLKEVVGMDLRFAPTFTTYLPEYKLKSVEAAFLKVGMANRSKEKKLKFAAKERGDTALADYHDNMQLMLKILNNSSSGAKATAGTILYNQTGHSTLTSVCRSTTSFANAINEKLLGGYRHYYNVEVTINNIISTLTYVDLELVKSVMDKYDLHYVENEELLWAIKRSTDLYWDSPRAFKKIEEFVNKLTPLQCSAYLYNSDIWMLRKFNDTFMRNWFRKLLSRYELTPLPDDEVQPWLDIMDDDLAALVAVYVAKECMFVDKKGKPVGKSVKSAMVERPEIKPLVAAVIKNTIETFEAYRDLIQAFLVTEVMPFETAHVPAMMRGVVLGSDTDSSLFALDDHWVTWYFDRIVHNEESRALVATCVYITTQHLQHVLGMMTGILNVAPEKRHLIAMKNEFLFSSFTTTSRGKHYYAKKEAQEGIIIPSERMDVEVKGVALKHGKVPAHITEGFHRQLDEVMNIIERDEQISILELRFKIASLENDIYQSIRKGEPIYLQRGQVKVKDAYKVENSIYKRGYEFWEDVFAPKYGHTVEPPYDCIKIATNVDTRAKFIAWVSTFEDKQLAARFIEWVDTKNEGKPLSTYYLPQAVAQSVGLPEEFISVMEPRKLVYTITSPYYLLLESFNIYEQNKNVTRLCSDDFDEWQIPTSLFEENE